MRLVLTCLMLFVTGWVTDIFWTRWSLSMGRRKVNPATWWAFLICLPAAVWAPAYNRSPWYVVPYALGACLGTRFTLIRDIRKEEKAAD